jgi:hypothetical protein
MSKRRVGIHVETIVMEEDETPSLTKGEEPVDMFGPMEGAKPTLSRKLWVYLVPINTQDYNEVCFKLIGLGTVFCTARDCMVSHHGGAIRTVTPGNICVGKLSSEAFVEPQMCSFNIDEQALQDWFDVSLSFKVWLEKFLMAEAAGNNVPSLEHHYGSPRGLLPQSSFAFQDTFKEEGDYL